MGTILLTGIPRVGKTRLVEITRELTDRFYGERVESISIADIVAEAASTIFGTPSGRVHKVDNTSQRALRWGAISEAALWLGTREDDVHRIVDTPMTMYTPDAIPDIIFSSADIARLQTLQHIDYFVTVIDDPNLVAKRLEGTGYPTDIGRILDWMTQEVMATRAVWEHSMHRYNDKTRRHLVIPLKHSDETLAKLLADEKPNVVYLAMPLTHLRVQPSDGEEEQRRKREDRENIGLFEQKLQEYGVVIRPIEMDNILAGSPESKHTVHRDLNWFVQGADVVVAYFPRPYQSTGVPEEMRQAIRLGKPVVLIHPGEEKEVFGFPPTLRFQTTDDFFGAIHSSRMSECYKASEYDFLRKFLDSDQDVPRYAHLRPYAVAVDIRDGDKHLLIRQGQDKQFAGRLMLLAGKRTRGQTDFDALRCEAWEEIQIALAPGDIQKGYRIYRVDYPSKKVDGIDPQYVRIYSAVRGPMQGEPRVHNALGRREVDSVQLFSIDEILGMPADKVVPATRAYFVDLKKNTA